MGGLVVKENKHEGEAMRLVRHINRMLLPFVYCHVFPVFSKYFRGHHAAVRPTTTTTLGAKHDSLFLLGPSSWAGPPNMLSYHLDLVLEHNEEESWAINVKLDV